MIRISIISIIAAASLYAMPANSSVLSPNCDPKYLGRLVITPDPNGRSMTLQEPFGFVDNNCRTWNVPKGAAVDGASIPRWLWSILGGPWEGAYRDASVVHDWYCYVRTRPWKDVHRMFFDGMIASGVGAKKAKIMYLGVYYGGPRWDELTIRNSRLLSASMQRVSPDVFRTVSVAHSSLAQGSIADAEMGLATARTEMVTNGDQYAVADLARNIAWLKNDRSAVAASLDAMIFSGVPDLKSLELLQLEKAKLAIEQGDLKSALLSARRALDANPGGEAGQILAEIRRQAPEAMDSADHAPASYEPTELEFQRLTNIVEKGDFSLDQIEDLVDEVRKPESD